MQRLLLSPFDICLTGTHIFHLSITNIDYVPNKNHCHDHRIVLNNQATESSMSSAENRCTATLRASPETCYRNEWQQSENKCRFYSTMRVFISLGKQLSRRVLHPPSFDSWSQRWISDLLPGVHRWATTHSRPRERMHWNFTRDHRQSEFEPWSRLQQCKRYCSHRRDQNEGDPQRSNRDFAACCWYLNSESSDPDIQTCAFAICYHNVVWNRNERILCAHWSIFSPIEDREAHSNDTADEGSWRNPTVWNQSNVWWSGE